ncbi:hypothetical protein CLU81_4945 [Flavobacterium sp. 9]|uniref:hypothetical protein n=1 Tax=Flavobacterium sp. 9 TaxID=2035198 RepID=UPI000C1A4639|nr:hypothetical protein [Flavobacterium sp. 9]PIF34307.1 hypothetical protein CLU81_4945 [Flavobacterium sp. 9]
MKKYNYLIPFFYGFLLLFSISLKAQVIVDGDLSEWGDSKKMKYDNENNLYYAFKKDNQFLYLSILKNKNASKFNGGGIQVFFSNKEADTTGLQVLFANRVKDTETNKNQKYTHDFFSVKNLNGVLNQQLATYNETGILVEWKVTDIQYFVIRNGVVDEMATPANPNVFTAEIQIPLAYLQKYNLDKTIHFGISMRGQAYNFKMPWSSVVGGGNKSTSQKEFLDKMTPTSFFGSIDLNEL